MYEHNGVSESTLASLHQLRTAVIELSTALNESLRDDRSNATACLQRAKTGLAPWQVRRVLAHIEAHMGLSIRNQELADIARLSIFHFNVAFRNSVGDSPHAYIIRRRIERAQRLMLSTQQSLSDIAAECGLADQAHLTRLFRRLVGESPAAWRRARVNPKPSWRATRRPRLLSSAGPPRASPSPSCSRCGRPCECRSALRRKSGLCSP